MTKHAPHDPRLQKALRDAEGKSTGSEKGAQGWVFRHAMDAALKSPLAAEAHSPASMPAPIAVSAPASEATTKDPVKSASMDSAMELPPPPAAKPVPSHAQICTDIQTAIRIGVPIW